MHREILTPRQIKLLPIIKKFSSIFSLVGGTAVALQLGHRRSVDFDLVTPEDFKNSGIRTTIVKSGKKVEKVAVDEFNQFTFFVGGVKLTFFQYPFRLSLSKKLAGIITMPDLLTLAAMKAYALGRRAKWKDYVDLYFIATHYGGIEKIVKRARAIFGHEFNEKIFRVQLAYFRDIDDTEEVEFLPGFAVTDRVIREQLKKFSVQ